MKHCHMETQATGNEGLQIVKPLVEKVLDQPLTVTQFFYDTMDLEGSDCFVEIKTRTEKYHWEDEKIEREGWLIPACKIERAQKEQKKCYFYYYWRSDKSLWELEYCPELFQDLNPVIPWWHKDQQRHYYVPRERWTLIEFY